MLYCFLRFGTSGKRSGKCATEFAVGRVVIKSTPQDLLGRFTASDYELRFREPFHNARVSAGTMPIDNAFKNTYRAFRIAGRDSGARYNKRATFVGRKWCRRLILDGADICAEPGCNVAPHIRHPHQFCNAHDEWVRRFQLQECDESGAGSCKPPH
jgi:hypothetical protein